MTWTQFLQLFYSISIAFLVFIGIIIFISIRTIKHRQLIVMALSNTSQIKMTEIKGIQFNAPPKERIASIQESLARAINQLPKDAKGGLFILANETHGNAVIAHKFNDSFVVDAWIGKVWKGSLNYGVEAKIIWS